MGSNFALGIQKYIMACAKHFACKNFENSRQFVDVEITSACPRNLPAAFQDVRGRGNFIHHVRLQCGQRHLLQREQAPAPGDRQGRLGLQGFIVSDFGAVHDGLACANAGLDVEMPNKMKWGLNLKNWVLNGKVKKERIDDAVHRILREKFRFGLFDSQPKLDRAKIAGKEHAAVALEAERKAIVLLKNEKSTLPLPRKELKTIAVFGARAEERDW